MNVSHRFLLVSAILGTTSAFAAQPDTTIKYYDSWNSTTTPLCVVTHGEYDNTPLRWYTKWWPTAEDEPGTLTQPEGSAWCLINNSEFTPITTGNPLGMQEGNRWVGANSSAPKIKVKKEGLLLTYDTVGTWADSPVQNSIDTSVPTTWKDGAEGAYVMIHEGFGSLPYAPFIKPILDVAKEYSQIKTTLALSVPDMDDAEWEAALSAAIAGHELVVGNSHLTLMNDVFEEFQVGDTIVSSSIKYIPEQFQGAVVGDEFGNYVTKTFAIPSLDYPNGVSAAPETLWTDITLEVSPDFGNSGKTITVYGETVPFPGTIKAGAKLWSDEQSKEIPMLRLKTVPALPEEKFISYLENCRKEINEKVYSQIVVMTIKPAPKCEIYYSGREPLSLAQRAKIKESGFLAALGGWNESRQITPAEFIHPGYINVDFYDGYDDTINTDEVVYFSQEKEQAYTLSNLPVRAADLKGVVIRGLSGVTSNMWNSFNESEFSDYLSYRIVETNRLKLHYGELSSLMDAKRIALYTPSELIRSKLFPDSEDGNPVAVKSGNGVNSSDFRVQQNGSSLSLTVPQGAYNLNIYSVSGRVIHQEALLSESGATQAVSLSGFAKGVLLMEISQGNRTVVKQKILNQ